MPSPTAKQLDYKTLVQAAKESYQFPAEDLAKRYKVNKDEILKQFRAAGLRYCKTKSKRQDEKNYDSMLNTSDVLTAFTRRAWV